jgi:transcriptional regulator with XRE-family HTH domain
VRRKKSGGGLRLYKSYMFRDKDPIIDALRTAMADDGATYSEIHDRSGVSTVTQRNWFKGETRRPQFATVAAFARACGKEGVMFGPDGAPRLVGRQRPHLRVVSGGGKRRA